MKVSRARFERMAERAFAEIPEYFREKLGNISIEIRDLPGPEAEGRKDILGLHIDSDGIFPARVLLYQRNLEAECDDATQLQREIRLTLKHELAHHFGFCEKDIKERWPEGA